MFIGRESELATLEKAYQKDAFQFIILYGRRRVGKTRLMAEFSQGRLTCVCGHTIKPL